MLDEKEGNRNIEDKDLKSLRDHELKDEILDVNRRQLSKIGKMAYCYFINTSININQLLKDKDLLDYIGSNEEEETIKTIYQHSIDVFKKLHMESEGKKIEEEIDILLDMREELYSLLRSIHCYETELSYIKESIDYHTMKVVGKREYKNIQLDEKEIALVIDKIGNVLADNIGNHVDFVRIVSNILGILPFRMSKPKYFDVIKATLVRNLNGYPVVVVENRIESYKMLFDSSLIGDYGIMFDDYFTRVQMFKNIDYTSYCIDELDNLSEEILNLALELGEIGSLITTLGVLINRLISMLLISKKSLLDVNIDSNKLYPMWVKQNENIDESHISSLKELTNRTFAKAEKGLLRDVQYFETLNKEGTKRPGFLDKELNKNMLFTNRVLTYYNDMNLIQHNVLFPKEQEVIEKYYLEQLTDSLIQYINRSISTMDNVERKLRMRRLLSALELPFQDIEEFISYIEYSLDERVVSKEEILFTIDGLNYWLDSRRERQ